MEISKGTKRDFFEKGKCKTGDDGVGWRKTGEGNCRKEGGEWCKRRVAKKEGEREG